jgi:hypothetical protein
MFTLIHLAVQLKSESNAHQCPSGGGMGAPLNVLMQQRAAWVQDVFAC